MAWAHRNEIEKGIIVTQKYDIKLSYLNPNWYSNQNQETSCLGGINGMSWKIYVNGDAQFL